MWSRPKNCKMVSEEKNCKMGGLNGDLKTKTMVLWKSAKLHVCMYVYYIILL